MPPEFNQNQMPMDMENQEEQPQKILAHFELEELAELDAMQGGMTLDPETGLREYILLSKILQDPNIESAVQTELSGQREQPKFAEGGMVNEPGRPNDPELEALRLQGQHGDTELAIITPQLVEIFSSWAGKEPEINRETGLPQFGIFSNILRIVAPVVGAFLGGPIGGALGGFLGGKLTGQSTGAALKSGLLGGAIPFVGPAMQGLGGMIGGTAGGALSGLGGLLGKVTGGGIAQGIGGGVVSNLANVGKMMPAVSQTASQAPQVLPMAAGQTTGQGGFLSGLMGGAGQALPMVGAGLMLAKGRQQENKQIREYEKERKRENEEERRRLGFDKPFKKRPAFDLQPTNAELTEEQLRTGRSPRFFNYAEGGAIHGIGKGQQDNIHKNLKEGSYIIDASTVSDIGDGSSQAGIKELDRYFSKVSRHPSENMSKGGYIKAMVSNDEYEVPSEIVTSLGKGSNDQGAKILKKFVKQVRAKKRTSGDKLPPKSKSIGGYLSKIRHA